MRRAATATAFAMAGLTGAFGWILLMDVIRYGALPDPGQLPVQLLLVAATVVAATRRPWASAAAAVIAFIVGVGSAVQPVTVQRLTDPETLGFQVATVLLLAFAVLATGAGLVTVVTTVRLGRSRRRR